MFLIGEPTITEDCLQCEINMNLELENKTALVTGSTAGIGLAIAASLAREGATVIINGRTKKRVNGAIKQILAQHSNAKLEPLDADVSASADVAATIRRFSKLDILINNVGIGELKPFEKISDADWLKLIETNFMSGVRLSGLAETTVGTPRYGQFATGTSNFDRGSEQISQQPCQENEGEPRGDRNEFFQD